MVDISINQQTVHWCDYSTHLLEKPYREFEDIFAAYNREYYKEVACDFQKEIIVKILQGDVEYL